MLLKLYFFYFQVNTHLRFAPEWGTCQITRVKCQFRKCVASRAAPPVTPSSRQVLGESLGRPCISRLSVLTMWERVCWTCSVWDVRLEFQRRLQLLRIWKDLKLIMVKTNPFPHPSSQPSSSTPSSLSNPFQHLKAWLHVIHVNKSHFSPSTFISQPKDRMFYKLWQSWQKFSYILLLGY